MEIIDKLKYDDNGLIPAVVVDYYTGKVLTVAYMNKQSLSITIKEQKVSFFSRSRQELWRKGETSGNYQHVINIATDCDNDALVITVKKDGPACHLGTDSCFNEYIYTDERQKQPSDFSLQTLFNIISDRKTAMPEGSYTTYLFTKGKEKILKKVGEECTEVVIGAMKNDKPETIYEISDLYYHLLVLMNDMEISMQDILSELESRHKK